MDFRIKCEAAARAAMLALASSPAGSQSAAPNAGFALEPCTIDGVDREARCGTYHVFENRGAMACRTLPIRVVVVPARAADPDPETIF